MVAETGWQKHKRLMRAAPEIARDARVKGLGYCMEEYDAGPIALNKIIEADRKRRGDNGQKPTLTVNKLFLHPDGQTYFQSTVKAVANIISDLKAKLAMQQEGFEKTLERKEARIAELESQIAKLQSSEGDDEALLILLEAIQR